MIHHMGAGNETQVYWKYNTTLNHWAVSLASEKTDNIAYKQSFMAFEIALLKGYNFQPSSKIKESLKIK